ncbi:hypothetical protein [Sedimenticola sp.]|uniref:hypothetical protein n=1 Tax=Sedimenticola sp. TaxID=1940285 RepID=UPI0025842ABE|nr:hypothetical protein [Sedimenticola sp.]MCW8903507.1 hypothetical protein [Sedimenticola sp.]
MKKRYLSLSCLLLLPAQAPADEQAELAIQRDQLRHEIEHIRQTTRDARTRLDALQELLEAQREQNRLLDQQLQTESVPHPSGSD